MKGRNTAMLMIAMSLAFVLFCAGHWLGNRQRGVVIAESTISATGIAPAEQERDEEIPILDLNTATAEDFAKLPGIGEKLAETIVKFREENGPFGSVWELVAVSGIGDGKLDKILPYLKIE